MSRRFITRRRYCLRRPHLRRAERCITSSPVPSSIAKANLQRRTNMTTYSREQIGASLHEGSGVRHDPSGRVDMHFIVRLLVNPKTGISEVIGYLTYKEGIGTALFAGAPSEKTAHFTLRIPDLRS